MHITSFQNPRIKQVLKLKKRSERDKIKKFIIEGYREIKRAHASRWPISCLLFSEQHFLGENEKELIESIAKNAEVISCSNKVFEKISYRDRPDGLIAIAPIIRKDLESFVLPKDKPALIIVAEAIEKPGNLGTILRSADAAGVDCLIVSDKCTDIFNPNVVRASVGTLFTVPVFETDGNDALKWLKERDVAIVAATPHASIVYTQVDLTKSVAIAVGTEQLGLSDLWMKKASIQVKIPMLGDADSLNVATATTLLLYEAVRQRGLY